MTIGTDVPNVSIKHDKIDKEQIDRATAINTDFEISGKKTSTEDLGFNTDIDKVQEKTKDEEKHLDAELHTDLIGEDKRNEIKYAYKKLGSLHEILNQKKFKESMEGVLVDKFKDEHQKEFNLIKDENLSLEDKQKLAQNLVERYLRENGYQGVIPEVLLTDEAHSFTVDSKDKVTGAKRREKIYFSINDIADPNLAFSRLFGHEKAHMNTYDEGKKGEETAIHTREKIGSENKNKVFTEKEKADYLNNLRNKYKDQKSIEQQFAEAKHVDEKDKEHFDLILTPSLIVGGTALIYRYAPEITEAAVKYGPLFLSMIIDPPKVNKEDEIDNLDDIKNYKSRVISNKENEILDNDEETKDFEQKDVNIYYAKKQSRKSGKELGNDYPDWTNYEPPEDDEDPEDYLERILDEKYGKGKWKKGPGSDYNRVKKAIERGGHKAWNAK